MAQKIPDILKFLHRINKLKDVTRFNTSLSENGDTVADHSWRLALMVFLVGSELEIPVNVCRAMQLALVHDLAELETGDIDAYDAIVQGLDKSEKKKKEAAAMQDILKDISFGSSIHALWEEYEAQESPEAKFVRALDRIEAYLHLDNDNTGLYVPEEFHGDYADDAVQRFDDAVKHFPPLKQILDPVKTELKQKFDTLGVKWVEK